MFKKQSPSITLVFSVVLTSFALWLSMINPSLVASVPGDSDLRADSEIVHPRLISRVNPVYPEAAREAELEATTIHQVLILRDGTVEVNDNSCLECTVNRRGKKPEEVLRGWCDDFCRASSEAVSQWIYEPAKRDGEPVDAYFTVAIEYQIE